ncbi:MAG: class I SAM-dependent methyltransferase [Acidobacteria bacterium]|nr:class I SAM-dependent methyltransferase [Acidobacteriota bacterium]
MKAQFLANLIVAIAEWLARRSLRVQRLLNVIFERLYVSKWLNQPPAAHPRFTPEQMIARTDTFNAASDRYFAEHEDLPFLLGKPYTDTEHFARRLFDMGVLAHWLRLAPGDVVMELGAGTCWLLHFLNRYGCPTIAVDVSPAALEMGRELFQRDPLVNWDLDPQFLPYDGHRIPLPDGHVDRIILYDAFHHIPNQEEILREMARVLNDGGVVAMREPAAGHSRTEESRREMDTWDVLENDIDVAELEPRALACGFSRMTVVPIDLPLSIEVPASRLPDFLAGRELRHYWALLATAMQSSTYIVLYKGEYQPTTRSPDNPRARIEPAVKDVRVTAGEPLELRVGLTNTGDTRWLSGAPDRRGATQLGAQLHHAAARAGIDADWSRTPLPHDVAPGGQVTLNLVLPAIETPGEYRIVLDVIAEHVCWFGERGSPTAEVPLTVL